MSNLVGLAVGALVAAVLWTGAMYLWVRPSEAGAFVVLLLSGLAFGVLWFAGMRVFARLSRRS